MAKMQLAHYEIQAELLKMLDEFDTICREHNLRYSLYAGTLLGAVRHKGFIPWDDDVDVVMPRTDYEKFLSIASNVLGGGRHVINGHNSPFPIAFAKYLNTEIRVESFSYRDLTKEYLWLDIFPLDNSFETLKEMQRFVRWRQALLALAYSTSKRSKSHLKQAFKNVYKPTLGRILTAERCVSMIEEGAMRLNGKDTQHIGMMAWGGYGAREWFDKSMFDSYQDIEFEGHMFKAATDADRCLTQLYGDYMVVPPVEEQVTHEFNAWRE